MDDTGLRRIGDAGLGPVFIRWKAPEALCPRRDLPAKLFVLGADAGGAFSGQLNVPAHEREASGGQSCRFL
jgi:hypothetical protein